MTKMQARCPSDQNQLGKSDETKVSNLETSAWQRRSIERSNSGIVFESR